jgi:hypothetical protein
MSEEFRKQSEEIQPENIEAENVEPKVEAEMPEDFEDPEGKAGKWKTVKGEVEIEGKKVEVTNLP